MLSTLCGVCRFNSDLWAFKANTLPTESSLSSTNDPGEGWERLPREHFVEIKMSFQYMWMSVNWGGDLGSKVPTCKQAWGSELRFSANTKSQGWLHTSVICCWGWEATRQEDSLSSLTSQSSRIDNLQIPWETLSQNIRGDSSLFSVPTQGTEFGSPAPMWNAGMAFSISLTPTLGVHREADPWSYPAR